MADSGPSTVTFQGLANRIVRGLLRAPLLSRVVGKRLITLYVVGRKSGKHYTIPVAYTRHGDLLLIGSGFSWIRNVRSGDPLPVRYLGRRRLADVEVLTDEPSVVRDYTTIVKDNRQFATMNKVSFAPDGTPDPGDLHNAWSAGARVLRLTLR